MTRRAKSFRERVGGFAIPLGLFIAIGVALWGWNAWRLLRGRATPALVVSSGVATSRGRNGTSYSPRVAYRYDVGGAPYYGTKVLAGSGESRGREWAQGIAARFTVGDSTTAYVNPRDPSDAYLVRQPSAGPVFVIAFPLAILGLIALGGTENEDDPMPPPDPAPSGSDRWTLAPALEPAHAAAALARAARQWRLPALALVVAHVALVVVCAAVAGSIGRAVATLWRATAGDGFFVFSLAALAGIGYYHARRVRSASDAARRVLAASVSVDRDRVRAGEAVVATFDISGATLHRVALRMECETTDPRTNKRLRHESLAPRETDGGPPATFALPVVSPPSSVVADHSPRTTWAFVAKLEFADGCDAELRFPVRVHAAQS